MIVDYLHPRKFPIIGQIMKWTLRLLTTGTLIGVYQFNTEDVGECDGCSLSYIWTNSVIQVCRSSSVACGTHKITYLQFVFSPANHGCYLLRIRLHGVIVRYKKLNS